MMAVPDCDLAMSSVLDGFFQLANTVVHTCNLRMRARKPLQATLSIMTEFALERRLQDAHQVPAVGAFIRD